MNVFIDHDYTKANPTLILTRPYQLCVKYPNIAGYITELGSL